MNVISVKLALIETVLILVLLAILVPSQLNVNQPTIKQFVDVLLDLLEIPSLNVTKNQKLNLNVLLIQNVQMTSLVSTNVVKILVLSQTHVEQTLNAEQVNIDLHVFAQMDGVVTHKSPVTNVSPFATATDQKN